MARKRMIAPEFFIHGALYDLEERTRLPVRLAYAGLWTQADRAGRFVWKPRELKLAILPYDPVDFAAVLEALVAGGFVKRYVVDGKEYGWIPSFACHQTFHKNESASKLPPYPGEAPCDDGAEAGQGPTDGGTQHGAMDGHAPSSPGATRSVTVTVTDAVTDAASAGAAAATEPVGDASAEPRAEPPVAPLSVRSVAVALTVAGNQGAGERWGAAGDRATGEAMPRWTAGQAGSIALAELVIAEGISLDFARSAVYAACLASKRSEPPHALNYFAEPVREAWATEQTRRAMAGAARPDVIPIHASRDPGAPFEAMLAAMRAERAEAVS